MKRKEVTTDIIHDLTEQLEYKVSETIRDGRDKKPTVFLIEIRKRPSKDADIARVGKRGRRTATCVLKMFPNTVRDEKFYQMELAANTELVRSVASKTPEEACEAMFALLSNPPVERWPRCVGRMQVPIDLAKQEGDWVHTSIKGEKTCRGLLFEYMTGLVPLANDLLNDRLAMEFKHIIADLHALKVLHRDHIDHSAWPAVGFGNLFLRRNPETGEQGPVILDFNRAEVLTDTPRDKQRMAEEADRLADMLARAMSNGLVVDYIPKEVKKLL